MNAVLPPALHEQVLMHTEHLVTPPSAGSKEAQSGASDLDATWSLQAEARRGWRMHDSALGGQHEGSSFTGAAAPEARLSGRRSARCSTASSGADDGNPDLSFWLNPLFRAPGPLTGGSRRQSFHQDAPLVPVVECFGDSSGLEAQGSSGLVTLPWVNVNPLFKAPEVPCEGGAKPGECRSCLDDQASELRDRAVQLCAQEVLLQRGLLQLAEAEAGLEDRQCRLEDTVAQRQAEWEVQLQQGTEAQVRWFICRGRLQTLTWCCLAMRSEQRVFHAAGRASSTSSEACNRAASVGGWQAAD